MSWRVRRRYSITVLVTGWLFHSAQSRSLTSGRLIGRLLRLLQIFLLQRQFDLPTEVLVVGLHRADSGVDEFDHVAHVGILRVGRKLLGLGDQLENLGGVETPLFHQLGSELLLL